MATRTSERTESRFAIEIDEAMVSVGAKFGLYAAIAEVEPASETDIATQVGIDRELIGRWLSGQADAGYLYVDSEGRFGVSCPISDGQSEALGTGIAEEGAG
jgi:hypothetical protein